MDSADAITVASRRDMLGGIAAGSLLAALPIGACYRGLESVDCDKWAVCR
ncbi:hypothetical protein [Sphingomonas sanxanigenens]|nr:hypothetical protein [Sphingomonas sanxanigenens]